MAGPREIVTAQKIARAKVTQAKDLRRRMTSAERKICAALRGRKLGSHRALAALGLRVSRFTNRQIDEDLAGVVEAIANSLGRKET